MKLYQHYIILVLVLITHLPAAAIEVISIHNLRPSQTRISITDIENKVQKILVGYKGTKIENGLYTTQHPILVLKIKKNKTEFEYFLIDGHHEVLAAIRLGAKTILATIIESSDNIEKLVTANKKAYPAENVKSLRFYLWKFDSNNQFVWSTPLRSIHLLDNTKYDDVNRSFIGKTMVVRLSIESFIFPESEAIGMWVKNIKFTPPFAEFILADILRSNGFIAGPKDHLDINRIQEAKDILIAAKNGYLNNLFPFTWKGLNLSWLEIYE